MKLLKHILILIFLSLPFIALSTNIKERLSHAESLNGINDNEMLRIADSVLTTLDNSDTNFEIYNFKASYLKARVLNRKGKLDEALVALDLALETKKTNSIDVYFGNLFLLKGIIFKKKAKPNLALTNYGRAIQIFEEIQNCKSTIKGRNNLANYYNSLSNYEQAIEQYKICLNLLSQCPNPYQAAIINRNLAGLYFNYEKNYEKGIIHFKGALQQFNSLESSSKLSNLIIGTLNELTFLFIQIKDIDQAKEYSDISSKKISSETPIRLKYNYELNLAKINLAQSQTKKGETKLLELEKLASQNISLSNYKPGLLILIAEFYRNQKDWECFLNSVWCILDIDVGLVGMLTTR